jgi:hypothetical protein
MTREQFDEDVGGHKNGHEKNGRRLRRTSEELILLISYLSLIGIWFAIPSVNLLLNRDKRWPWAVGLLGSMVILLIIAYATQWDVLFPRSATENPPTTA